MRIRALTYRIFNQMIRDKRLLALMMLAPLLILTLIHFLFQSSTEIALKVGTYNINQEIIDVFDDNDIKVIQFSSVEDSNKLIQDNELDALIEEKDNEIKVTYKNSDPTATARVKATLQGALSKITIDTLSSTTKKQQEIIMSQQKLLMQSTGQTIALNNNLPSMDTPSTIVNNYIYGNENSNFFDTIVPILIGFFVFFFVFLISGMALLKERTTGTLDRLLATPIRRSEIVSGYLLGYGFFAIIQTIILVIYAVYGLKISVVGHISLVLLTNIIIASVALSFGILLSTFANSEFQMMQFIPIVVIPQIFFSGMIPIENMAKWLQVVAHFMPMYYVGNALQGVMIRGSDFKDIAPDLGVLLIFALVFTIFNIVGLKRYRKV